MGNPEREKDKSEHKLDERKTEATSNVTLSDIEATEEDSSVEKSKEVPGPSPDGPLDAPDGVKDGGPM